MESRASPQNNLVIWTIPFFFSFFFDGGEHVCAWSAQCFNSLSLVWEEIALQMRLIHSLHPASGQRSRGGLPEWRLQYFHVLICPPRVWRYKSLFSTRAGKRGSPRESVVFYSVSGGNRTSCNPPLCVGDVLGGKN